MKARFLALVGLGLLPATSPSPVAASQPSIARARSTSDRAPSSPERCSEAREAEVALAAYQVRLLQQLEHPGALAWEKDAWRKELEFTRESLEGVDQLLAETGCPDP